MNKTGLFGSVIVFLGEAMKKNTGLETNSLPQYFFDSITDVAPEDIFAMGGTAVGIDLDNTAVYDSTGILFSGVKSWLKKIQSAGLPVVIVTNTYTLRAKAIAKKLGGLPFIANADKPDIRCFEKAVDITGTELSGFVMIGDQLFTDVQGANNAGAISVRVKYKTREILALFHFLKIRKLEKIYLESKGKGDKI